MSIDPKLTEYIETALKTEERLRVWVLVPGGALSGIPIYEQAFWRRFGEFGEDYSMANDATNPQYLHLEKVELVSGAFAPREANLKQRRPRVPIVRVRLDDVAAWGLVDTPREDSD